jgi:hypothetical protein
MERDRPNVRIGELRLQLPGDDRRMAGHVARSVAEAIAADLPPTSARRIGALHLRVPAGGGDAALVRRIARAIREAMR